MIEIMPRGTNETSALFVYYIYIACTELFCFTYIAIY